MSHLVAYLRRASSARLADAGRLIVALAAVVSLAMLPALAQSSLTTQAPQATTQSLLLEADQLIYDFDRQTVTAIGNVQIYYGGYVLDAERVTYNQKSGRLIASGGVRMLEPSGYALTAERLDITDNFADAFVESLNVVTPDRGRFAAQSAERRDANLTIFNEGVYTACEPCREHPERPPLWQIKAARIIHNRAERTVYYESARLEFLGVPVAYTPIFYHPDPTVKRKSGFLVPSGMQNDALGVGVTTPFFWNLAPDYDITLSPTFLTRQGLLGQAEWRQRLMNGAYSIRAAGIFQRDPEAFTENGTSLSGDRVFRGSARTIGDFAINDDWSFGWDLNTSTDRTFNRDYQIPGATDTDLASTIYLDGASETNNFELRGYHFLVQRENTVEDLSGGGEYVHDDQKEQALVHPVLDHNYILGEPLFGGELRLDSNLTADSRQKSDIRHPPAPFLPYYAGVAGDFARASSRASWQRRFVAPGGQLITPFSYLRSDVNWVAAEDPGAGLPSSAFLARAMPAAGIEYQWPFLASLGSTIHTFGPKAQLIARPNEAHPGELPNEDAQSLIFDDTTLFRWDKFSGYDRVEGGVRANVGLLYQGLFPGGAAIDAVFGQSYQLAGENSFALRDHVQTGLGSGLADDVSDYVSRMTVNSGLGVAVTGQARFGHDDFDVNAGSLTAVGTYGASVASLGYNFYRTSQAAGIFSRREEINAAAAVEFVDNWSVVGSVVYDLKGDSLVSTGIGLSYADDCFELSAVYSETTDAYSDLVADRRIFFRVSLRTLASSAFTSSLGGNLEETSTDSVGISSD